MKDIVSFLAAPLRFNNILRHKKILFGIRVHHSIHEWSFAFFRCKSWSFNFIFLNVPSLLGSSIAVRKFCLTYFYHQHSLCNYCLIHIIWCIVFSKAITSWRLFFFSCRGTNILLFCSRTSICTVQIVQIWHCILFIRVMQEASGGEPVTGTHMCMALVTLEQPNTYRH